MLVNVFGNIELPERLVEWAHLQLSSRAWTVKRSSDAGGEAGDACGALPPPLNATAAAARLLPHPIPGPCHIAG